jgi:hypothetical protein
MAPQSLHRRAFVVVDCLGIASHVDVSRKLGIRYDDAKAELRWLAKQRYLARVGGLKPTHWMVRPVGATR